MTDTTATRVGVIGLGGIGGGVAQRLNAAGVALTVYNRTEAKTAPFAGSAARIASTPAELARDTDVVILSLSDEKAVDDVLFGQLAGCLRPGQTVVEMSTVSPQYARESAARLAEHGVARVEACVIGNPRMAADGELRVFAAGEESAVEAVRPLLGTVGRQGVRYLGPAGRAAALKLAFNLLLGIQTAGLAEAVTFAEAAGVDRESFLTSLVKSGWRSPVLNFRAEFMRVRRYVPAGFRARLMAKDLDLAVRAAEEHDCVLPLVRATAARYRAVVGEGRGDSDAAVVLEVPAVDDQGHHERSCPS